MNDNQKGGAFGLGNPNDAFAKCFIGQSYLNLLTKKEDYIPNVINLRKIKIKDLIFCLFLL